MSRSYYHLSVGSKDGVLFRDDSDYRRGFNCLALAVSSCKVRLLADCFMSNHVHFCIEADDCNKVVDNFRISYQRYFNNKYGKIGYLGDREYVCVPLTTSNQSMVALAYVLRNPYHHGVSSTPFNYEYSSVKTLFRKDIGFDEPKLFPKLSRNKANLPHNAPLPKEYAFDSDGQISRFSVIDIDHVEHLFVSPQKFMFAMSRTDTKRWREDLDKLDADHLMPSLKALEPGFFESAAIEEMDRFTVRQSVHNDNEICAAIDSIVHQQYRKESIYRLSDQEKVKIGCSIIASNKRTVHIKQVARCLDIPATDFETIMRLNSSNFKQWFYLSTNF